MDLQDHSRVTVECHDPSGIFPLVQDQLLKRLPLRNLKWKAASRPLRQIDALHVDFGTHSTAPSTADSSTRPEYNRPSATTPAGDHRPERRHQIPGLRQTPYVKVYLVRCDDKEAYKTKVRKQIQTWISANSPPTQSTTALNKHQYHDACDLLILHVVMPGTVAASEPRWSQHSSQDSDELAERSKRTPWPIKSGTTVLDKIRSDFSIHAKNDFDRVAQVRLQTLPNALPTATTVQAYPESAQEQEQAWQGFMSKLKTSILHSFDLRVSQYEDDIREKEAQRTLPGWNFCTFFTLKEGLARGFESVGLVEDSLAIYEELSAGLDAVSRKDTTLLGDMSHMRDVFIELLRSHDRELVDRIIKVSSRPLDLNIQDYRNMIVSSTISVFDFKAYLFMREKSLLYRLADFGLKHPSSPPELSLISEVCAKAAAFVTSNMRVLRHELHNGQDDPSQGYADLIDAICASWAYAAVQQILKDTDTISTVTDTGQKPERSNSAGGANAHPVRKSSLTPKPDETKPKSGHDNGTSSVTAVSDPSLAELIATRADLFLLQRRIVESLAGRRSWFAGLAAVEQANQRLIDSDSKAEILDVCLKVLTPSLATALVSMSTFQTAYETLSDLAVRHYLLAGRTAVAEALLGDIALLKFQLGDYSSAVQHFQRTARTTVVSTDHVQIEMLKTHAVCLKKLNRRDDFIRISLKALHASPGKGDKATQALKAIIEASRQLTYDYVVPLADFSTKRVVQPYIEHFPDRDGFFIRFSCQRYFTEDLTFDQISLKMLDAQDAGQELVLKSPGPVTSEQGLVETCLHSNVSTCGQYVFDSLTLQIDRLHFVHSFQRKEKQTAFAFANSTDLIDTPVNIRSPSIVCYPKQGSLQAQLHMSSDIHVGQRRSLRLDVMSGAVPCQSLDIRLRPATAGLRLYSSDACIVSGSVASDPASPLSFHDVAPRTQFALQVPYSLETPLPEILVKLEISYTTDNGAFTFLSTTSVVSALALDVEVNDIFKTSRLYSRFRIRTNDGLPLRVDSARLAESESHAVEACPQADEMVVFDQQPLSLCYRITQKAASQASPLRLEIAYRRLDEQILSALVERFTTSVLRSEFADLERLLVPYLSDTAKTLMGAELLESACLNDAFNVPSFEASDWPKLIRALKPELRAGLKSWLSAWHTSNASLGLENISPGSRCILSVPMDVARIDIVQTAKLSLPDKSSRPRVNHPLTCILEFSFSRSWADPAKSHPSTASTSETFTYAMRPGEWLVAGPTRSTFSVPENQVHTVTLTVIPTSTGLITLPGVDVAPVSAVSGSSSNPATAEGTGVAGGSKVVYKTDFVSALEQVRVLPESQVSSYDVCRMDPEQTADRVGSVVRGMSLAESVSQVY